jgi:hypothetical protein
MWREATGEDPVGFSLPIRNSTRVVHSHPLMVRPKEMRIQRSTVATAASGSRSDTLQFSAGIPDHLIEAEIAREKPTASQANANADATSTKAPSNPPAPAHGTH